MCSAFRILLINDYFNFTAFFCVVGQKKMCRCQSVGCRRVGDITFQFVVCREFLGTGLV